MYIVIIAKTELGRVALDKLVEDSRRKSTKLIGKVEILHDGQAVKIEPRGLRHIPQVATSNQAIQNIIITATYEMMQGYGLSGDDYEVGFNG